MQTVSQMFTPTLGLREAQCIRLDRVGDQICIFGFSRGAMTARAFAGMLQKVELLPAWNPEQLPLVYAVYLKDDHDGQQLSAQFKQTFCLDVEIKFLGIWYIVRPVHGLPASYPPAGTPCTPSD